jgi:hypothetical protein
MTSRTKATKPPPPTRAASGLVLFHGSTEPAPPNAEIEL